MREYLQFYIDGKWVDPVRPNPFDVENPATEQVSGRISLGSAADVDVAVKAARRAFASWSQSSRKERLDLLEAILAEYQKRAGDQNHREDHLIDRGPAEIRKNRSRRE